MFILKCIQKIGCFIRDVKEEVLICKYTQLATRLIECMEDEGWSFSEAAEFLMCTQKEFYACIGILRLKTETVEEAVRAYILNDTRRNTE